MNIALLKFMEREVRVRRDPSHQEYRVIGLNWATEEVWLSSDDGFLWVHHSELDLVPEEYE